MKAVQPAVSLSRVYQRLYRRYGPQHWWPGETPFEVMVGAVLTQNTAWSNVEKAIALLKASRLLHPERIAESDHALLAQCLKPSGYFNIKARRLQSYCRWYLTCGGFETLDRLDTPQLRAELLAVKGVGPETADDILLYAFNRPVFVIDAYTRRLFARLGMVSGAEGYEHLQVFFEQQLGPDVPVYNEYHALIVAHAKAHCRKRPECENCCLAAWCGLARIGRHGGTENG